MPEPRDKRVELILQSLEGLPTLPTVALQLLEATSSRSSTTGEIVRLIESDPALTTRIMKLVHRADLGAGTGVNTVERAVVLLGLEAIRNAVLAVSVFEVFQSVGAASATFNRNDFWKHCIAVACCSELLATSMVAKGGKAAGVHLPDINPLRQAFQVNRQ